MKAELPFFVLAYNIRSLQNVGSIFRTSDVFGVTKLFLSGYTGHPPDLKIQKVALGAEETLPWEYQKSPVRIIQKLRLQYPKLEVLGLENHLPKPLVAKNIYQFQAKQPVLLVLGEEVAGIPKKLLQHCDVFVEIPQFGHKESLNVSVAFGIAAFALRMSP
jgi:tRNA G18 (ribose-2'-O)-methylase SpoU